MVTLAAMSGNLIRRSPDDEPCPSCGGLGFPLAVERVEWVDGTAEDWSYAEADVCGTCDGSGMHRCLDCGATATRGFGPRGLREGLCEACHELVAEFLAESRCREGDDVERFRGVYDVRG